MNFRDAIAGSVMIAGVLAAATSANAQAVRLGHVEPNAIGSEIVNSSNARTTSRADGFFSGLGDPASIGLSEHGPKVDRSIVESEDTAEIDLCTTVMLRPKAYTRQAVSRCRHVLAQAPR